ncbi:unnamed protein product [Nesidiocoris tenuis]|uniref:Uncharacterized protein n=1 Tax=Nesidiocoris tenuis TaxID=355587 RepID=A0A6H5HM66_9HEMI|nr:unnamed protein product [Nesidiocoris tenuis]
MVYGNRQCCHIHRQYTKGGTGMPEGQTTLRWLSPKNRSCPGRALPPSRRGSEPFWDCRSRNPSNPGTVGTELSHTT